MIGEERKKLTKSKLTEILSLLNKATILSEYTLWDKDMIYPISIIQNDNTNDFIWKFESNLLNGVHLLENGILNLPGSFLFDSTSSYIEKLKEKLKETGIVGIELVCTEELVSVYIDGVYYNLLVKMNNISDDAREMMYESFDDRMTYLKVVSKSSIKSIDAGEISFILMGSVVKLVGNNGVVRISKNMFPLLGPVRTNAEDPFRAEYVLTDTSSGPAVILFTDYKKFRAIHIYNYIEY